MLFTAYQFLRAADVLKRSEEYQILFKPVLHLAAHGIEVLLKANLVGAGLTLKDVKGYGHKISKLWNDSRNQLLRDKALSEAEKVWQEAKTDEKWADEFGEDPKKLLEEYIEKINILHTAESDYALRYVAKPGTEGPRVHLLVDTFLFVSHFCCGQPYELVRKD